MRRILVHRQVSALVALAGVALGLGGGAAFAAGTINIDKAKMLNRTTSQEVTSGFARDTGYVEFRGHATCSCECDQDLTYTWHFGDTQSGEGSTVIHTYEGARAGNRSPYLHVECNKCAAEKESDQLTVQAINGIRVTQIGDKVQLPITAGRLSCNNDRQVKAIALPEGVNGSNLIDWHLTVNGHFLAAQNAPNGPLAALPNDKFWQSNVGWGGGKTLYTMIGHSTLGPPNQEGELALTLGSVSTSTAIELYYGATTSENPTADPNWFYYYKDELGGAADYTYNGALQTS